jgi:hypothetical protein
MARIALDPAENIEDASSVAGTRHTSDARLVVAHARAHEQLFSVRRPEPPELR